MLPRSHLSTVADKDGHVYRIKYSKTLNLNVHERTIT